MSGAGPLAEGLLVPDTSAWLRVSQAGRSREWVEAVVEDRIALSPLVELELLYAARHENELESRERDLAEMRRLPLDRSTARAAVGAMRDLAMRAPGYHRVPSADCLIAAAAEAAGATVVHYDRHFDRLSEVMSFESRWIAPPGSL